MLFLIVGQSPGFFADGTSAPMQFSNQFTAQEFQQHLDFWGIDAVAHVHPDMLPYRGCDEKSGQFVRFTAWLNCLQKDFDEILRISNLMKACRLWVYRYVIIVLSLFYCFYFFSLRNSHLNGLRGTYMGEEVVYKVVVKKYKSLIEVS